MKESTLLKVALACSLIGLFALYLISAKIEVRDYRPSLLNGNAGEDVRLHGTITKVTDKGGVVFIEVNQQNPVAVVLFTNSDVKLSAGDSVEIVGEVQEYNGKEEIIAQEIKVIK